MSAARNGQTISQWLRDTGLKPRGVGFGCPCLEFEAVCTVSDGYQRADFRIIPELRQLRVFNDRQNEY